MNDSLTTAANPTPSNSGLKIETAEGCTCIKRHSDTRCLSTSPIAMDLSPLFFIWHERRVAPYREEITEIGARPATS